jgi:hypothetical protein
MRIYRILAVVWLLLCSNAIFEVFWSLRRDISSPNFQAFPVLYSTIFTCLIFLAGIVASVCLFCGARWARWLLCCVIAIDALGDLIYVVKTESLLNRGGFFCILAFVSILLLLLPKREAVA